VIVNALQRLIGMLRAPRATLTAAVARPRSLDLGVLIIFIAALCSSGFLMTRVGRLAAMDQQVRQLESLGVEVDDELYGEIRRWAPYRPAVSAALIVAGWPILWMAVAAALKAAASAAGQSVSLAQTLTVVVHASSVLALRAVIEAPINYARESLGGATSLSAILPAFGQSTFPARLLGAVDIFVVWWVMLIALGLGILYGKRTLPIARWLLGVYAAAAAVLALVQALRGGI
jgi:hypothetical protein